MVQVTRFAGTCNSLIVIDSQGIDVNNEHADRYNAKQLVCDVCLPNTGG